jgi:hypothetical protein
VVNKPSTAFRTSSTPIRPSPFAWSLHGALRREGGEGQVFPFLTQTLNLTGTQHLRCDEAADLPRVVNLAVRCSELLRGVARAYVFPPSRLINRANLPGLFRRVSVSHVQGTNA